MNATINGTFSFVYQSANFLSVQSPLLCFVFRNCEIGNIILNNNGIPTCYLCPNQTYSLTTNAISCSACPSNAALWAN